MHRIIDAQPERSTTAWGNPGGRLAGARGGGVRRKDEILEMLDTDRNLLQLLVDVRADIVGNFVWPTVEQHIRVCVRVSFR